MDKLYIILQEMTLHRDGKGTTALLRLNATLQTLSCTAVGQRQVIIEHGCMIDFSGKAQLRVESQGV